MNTKERDAFVVLLGCMRSISESDEMMDLAETIEVDEGVTLKDTIYCALQEGTEVEQP